MQPAYEIRVTYVARQVFGHGAYLVERRLGLYRVWVRVGSLNGCQKRRLREKQLGHDTARFRTKKGAFETARELEAGETA